MRTSWIVRALLLTIIIPVMELRGGESPESEIKGILFSESALSDKVLHERAREIARRHGRALFPPLFDLYIKQQGTYREILHYIAAEVADPDNKHGMLSYFEVGGAGQPNIAGGNPDPIVPAAIVLAGGENSTDMLLRLAALDGKQSRIFDVMYACAFLRCFDPKLVRPSIEKLDLKHTRSNDNNAPIFRTDLLAYLDLMEKLKPAEREACVNFNRRFWLARALTQRQWHTALKEFEIGAKAFKFKAGDEVFLKYSLSPHRDRDEIFLALAIVERNKIALIMEVKDLALTKDADYQLYAREVLEILEKSPSPQTAPSQGVR